VGGRGWAGRTARTAVQPIAAGAPGLVGSMVGIPYLLEARKTVMASSGVLRTVVWWYLVLKVPYKGLETRLTRQDFGPLSRTPVETRSRALL